MLKALAAFAAISVNGQLNALRTPPPCCSDPVQCDEYMKLCLSGTQSYCDILPCNPSSSSCDPCPQGGSLLNGRCFDSVPATADGLCHPGYVLNVGSGTCEMSYPPAQFITDCPSPSPSPVKVFEQHSPSTTPNKCCNDATDECMILARRCASGDLTACGFVPCAPSPSPVEYAPSSAPYATVPSLCFNPCTKGGVPYAYDSVTKTISCRIVTDAINGTCNANYVMIRNECVYSYTTLYSPQSCSPSPVYVRESSTPSMTPKENRESSSMTPKVVPSSTRTATSSITSTTSVVSSSSASMTVKVVAERTQSNSMTPKIVDRESSSPSMTPKIVDRESSSPSMTPKIVDRESSSPSMTPKIVDRESSSPSMTPKIAERTQSNTMTPKVVPSSSITSTPTSSIAPTFSTAATSSVSPKPCDYWECPMDPAIVYRLVMYVTSTEPMCEHIVEAEYTITDYPASAEGVTGGSRITYWCKDKRYTVDGSKCILKVQPKYKACPSASGTPMSLITPSNADVFEYTNRPLEPLYTRKPDCNFWSCPAKYEITNVNGKVTCKYYKSADYDIIDLPDTPEGVTGGSWNKYYCPTGTKLITIQGAVEAEKYWCEGFTDAIWTPCPSVSSTPTMTYKNNVRSSVPNRSPISNASTTGAFPSRRVPPSMSPRPSPKFSKFPWFTPVMTKKPLFGTSISGALTFPRASITTIDKVKELQVHLACMFHVDIEKVSITSIVRYINGTKFNIPFDISTLSSLEVPLIGCYKNDTPSPVLARVLQSVNGDIVVNYAMTDSTAEILTVEPTVLQAAIASDPAIIDFASSVGSTTINSSANMPSSEDGVSSSNNNANFGAITGIAVVFGAILAVVGVVSATKYAQHRKRVAKNSKVIRFNDENSHRNPITYDTTKQMFTPTPTVNYII